MGRMPRAKKDDPFKTAFFKLYSCAGDPMMFTGFPDKELTFANIEKVIFTNMTPEYYLEGNDLVVRNIKAIELEEKNNAIYVTFSK
jgi:hypothetical protein